MSIITLLTDFGDCDWFSGAMKGVIKNINPTVEIVDISHTIAPQNIRQGAFVLEKAYSFFPRSTIHTVVVDPGVGSDRKSVLVETENYFFAAPDNGVLTLALDKEKIVRIVSLENPEYFLDQTRSTFDGRDVFAPVAAHLSGGADPLLFGPVLDDIQRFEITKPEKTGSGEIIGHVIYKDVFGNLITDIEAGLLEKWLSGETDKIRVRLGRLVARKIVRSYREGSPGEVVMLIGGSGHLEFAVNHDSAAALTGITEGHGFTMEVAR
ncbi:MAG: SAM-dependent chlorinase/fluorinase [Thermoplasmata archaeon]|nr:SAM-dependent chlorinase/fluorinase [Thermoplasmata archaeon]